MKHTWHYDSINDIVNDKMKQKFKNVYKLTKARRDTISMIILPRFIFNLVSIPHYKK